MVQYSQIPRLGIPHPLQLARRRLENFSSAEQCATFLHRHTGQQLDIGPEHCLGCSVGIVEINAQRLPKTVDHLLNLADHAMYNAKDRGKNQAVISEPISVTAPRATGE